MITGNFYQTHCVKTCNFLFLSWCYRLSNLFHGMDENTPVRYTVFCSLIKVAATCNAISFIPTDLDQVNLLIITSWDVAKKGGKQKLRFSFNWSVTPLCFFSRCVSGSSTGTWTQRRNTHCWGWCMKLWSTAKKGTILKSLGLETNPSGVETDYLVLKTCTLLLPRHTFERLCRPS